jgi:hypothetical protein
MLEDAGLIFLLPRHEQSVRKQARNPKKLHVIDPGLIGAFKAGAERDVDRKLETAVFLECRRCAREWHYYAGDSELDLCDAEGRLFINTCWNLCDAIDASRQRDARITRTPQSACLPFPAQAGGPALTGTACLQWHFSKHPLQQLHLRPTHPRLLRPHPQPLQQSPGISPTHRQLSPQHWIWRLGSGFGGNCWGVQTCAWCAWSLRQLPSDRKNSPGRPEGFFIGINAEMLPQCLSLYSGGSLAGANVWLLPSSRLGQGLFANT